MMFSSCPPDGAERTARDAKEAPVAGPPGTGSSLQIESPTLGNTHARAHAHTYTLSQSLQTNPEGQQEVL